MSTVTKRRISLTLDRRLIDAAKTAVAAGRAASVSAWINSALAARADHERRLSLLAEVVAAYEAEHGVITEQELVAQRRADRRASSRARRSSK